MLSNKSLRTIHHSLLTAGQTALTKEQARRLVGSLLKQDLVHGALRGCAQLNLHKREEHIFRK